MDASHSDQVERNPLEGLVPGRIVYFVFDRGRAEQANRRRTNSQSIADRIAAGQWPTGAQAHIGNEVHEGDIFPAQVIRVWSETSGCSNLQVALDGCDHFWATSINYDNAKAPGTWHWMYAGQNTRGNAK